MSSAITSIVSNVHGNHPNSAIILFPFVYLVTNMYQYDNAILLNNPIQGNDLSDSEPNVIEIHRPSLDTKVEAFMMNLSRA